VPRFHHLSAALITATLLTDAAPALAGRLGPALPAELPVAVRARLASVVDQASVATRVQGESFVARHDVFEFLV